MNDITLSDCIVNSISFNTQNKDFMFELFYIHSKKILFISPQEIDKFVAKILAHIQSKGFRFTLK